MKRRGHYLVSKGLMWSSQSMRLVHCSVLDILRLAVCKSSNLGRKSFILVLQYWLVKVRAYLIAIKTDLLHPD